MSMVHLVLVKPARPVGDSECGSVDIFAFWYQTPERFQINGKREPDDPTDRCATSNAAVVADNHSRSRAAAGDSHRVAAADSHRAAAGGSHRAAVADDQNQEVHNPAARPWGGSARTHPGTSLAHSLARQAPHERPRQPAMA